MILRKYTLENEFNGKKYHTDFDQTHSSSTPGERVMKTKLLLSRFFFIHATVGQMRAILVEKKMWLLMIHNPQGNGHIEGVIMQNSKSNNKNQNRFLLYRILMQFAKVFDDGGHSLRFSNLKMVWCWQSVPNASNNIHEQQKRGICE